ncbi:hypothetical protein [Candidatus Neptunochlamydia vexilliferae]|nr:hypothetical protein [Candidatus Neptunochlamydia vexilliferae]
MSKRPSKDMLLGDYPFESKRFEGIESLFSTFKGKEFQEKNEHAKADGINRALADLILKAPEPAFLIEEVVDFISRVRKENLLQQYTFSSFELWLNQFSNVSTEENFKIRGKVVGKWVPRDTYQLYFPIGMGKSYPGTHFVTAHNSPDLDTTVASFWGWVDAFAARVSKGLHIWNVPGGPPTTQVEVKLLFNDLFGEGIFDCLGKPRLSLTLTSLDLMTQQGMIRKQTGTSILSFDHERQRNAVVLIDKEGYYLGDWRTIDVEGVRQVILSLNNCLMWFESNLHIQLISCFSEERLTVDHISKVVKGLLKMKISECAPAKELPPHQLQFVNDYLVKVLQVSKGIEADFEQFARSIEKVGIVNFTEIIAWLKSLLKSELFDSAGVLTENRPLIFNQLEVLVKMLSEAFTSVRKHVDRLDIAFRIKTDVFGFIPQYLTHRTDLEEIRSKIGNYSYMTVNQTDLEGRQIPIGVVHAADLQQDVLGTVSLRDFCNREEMKIPSYLQVISVIDHHKSALQTDSPPKAVISDVQSSNAIVAELAFTINDQYGLGGMTEKEVNAQLKEMEKKLDTVQNIRIYQRLLQKKKVLCSKGAHYVSPRREMVEYLHFIYAILDDTDLLTKVSRIDVECMASLLNRLKSLIVKKEVEIVNFDDIKEDEAFTAKAAERLLQNKDFYSLYSKVYKHKEQGVDENFEKCLKGAPSNIFTDTKILNYCNRVGQTKIFARNYATFKKVAPELQKRWYEKALNIYANNREIMLHLHATSTVASAEELFKGGKISYDHQDEMWFWIPHTELAVEKLKLFLSGFKGSPAVQKLHLELDLYGNNARELSQIFKESFLPIEHHFPKGGPDLPIAVLRYNAGGLNSRKAMIAPYLPRLAE